MPTQVIKSTYRFLSRYYLFIGIIILIALVTLTFYNSSKRNSTNLTTTRSATDTAIIAAQNKVTMYATTVRYKVNLCNLYIQKSRETADASYYNKCDSLLAASEKLEPSNGDVIAAQSSVSYGRHNFVVGLALANKAVTLNPNRPAYYGLVGDGQIELGQYPEAAASFQTMINKRPELSSFNRVAYIREIYGDIAGAKTALVSAISAGSSFSENIAYSQVELGKLTARSDLNGATKHYNQALSTQSNFQPALEGLGKVAFAKGDYDTAIKYFNQAFTSLPLAQYATDLGDSYARKGDAAKSTQYYYLANLAFDKSSNGGVNNDYEKAVFLTDHDKDLNIAKGLLEKVLPNRSNIFTYDALAWNSYKLKDYAKAQEYSTKALEAGSNEPSVNFHASMIAAKQNQNDVAKQYLVKAFSQDKYFLESHFSLLDKQLATQALKAL